VLHPLDAQLPVLAARAAVDLRFGAPAGKSDRQVLVHERGTESVGCHRPCHRLDRAHGAAKRSRSIDVKGFPPCAAGDEPRTLGPTMPRRRALAAVLLVTAATALGGPSCGPRPG